MKTDEQWFPTPTDLDWIESAAPALHPVLLEIEEAARPERIPILDRHSGRVLAAFAAGRRRIVEVGTAYGYSTLAMALAQPPDGTIVTIDPDRERTGRARSWWRSAGIPDERITVVNAPALEAFAAEEPVLGGPFDLAFIDALKDEYPAYLEAIMPRLATGAMVVADNVLFSGRVSGVSPLGERPDWIEALRSFNRSVLHDPRCAASILPVGDGLLVAVVRP
jgi:predicted O-methyltransferase YrrM